MTPAPCARPAPSRLRLELAATELHRAAAHADANGDGDPFSPWSALAGHIRLVAAELAIVPEPPTPPMPPASDRAASNGSTSGASPTEALRLESWRTRDDVTDRATDAATVVLRHLALSAAALRDIRAQDAPTDLAHFLAHVDDLCRHVSALADSLPDDGPAALHTNEQRWPR